MDIDQTAADIVNALGDGYGINEPHNRIVKERALSIVSKGLADAVAQAVQEERAEGRVEAARKGLHAAEVVWRSENDGILNNDRLRYLQEVYVAQAIAAHTEAAITQAGVEAARKLIELWEYEDALEGTHLQAREINRLAKKIAAHTDAAVAARLASPRS